MLTSVSSLLDWGDSLERIVFQIFFSKLSIIFLYQGVFLPDTEKSLKVLGREFEGQPFFKRVSLNKGRKGINDAEEILHYKVQ